MRTPSEVVQKRICCSMSAFPAHLVEADGVLEAAELNVALVGEEEALAHGELTDDVGGEYLAGLGAGADAGGELDSGAEQVGLLSDGLAAAEADAATDGL